MHNNEEKEKIADYTARALLMPYNEILEYLIQKKWKTVSVRKRVKIIKELCSRYNVTEPVAINRVNEVIMLHKHGGLEQDSLDKAYQLVYADLCEKHAHVIALYNGTLHPDDVAPRQHQVSEMIQYIVDRGNKDTKR